MNPQHPDNSTNARLKAAVKSVEVPPFLEAKIRVRLQAPKPRHKWLWWTASAAAAGLAAALLIATQIGGIRQSAGDQESFIVSVSSRVATIMRVGLGDHIHCSFFRKFPAKAPAREEMETALGPQYKELIPVVERHVPAQYKLVLGHECRYHRRRFVHLSMKNDERLLSLIVTAKRDGEAFDIAQALPHLAQSGIPMYASSTDRFQIAAMETPNHLVYFVSDLPAGENSRLLVAMAPQIQTLLSSL